MLRQGKKEATAKSYASQIRLLFEDDGKGPSVIGTQEYFLLTKASYKNRLGNGQRSAAVRLFIEFYNEHTAMGAELEVADGSKIYQVNARSGDAMKRAARYENNMEGEQHTEEAKRLRTDLELPADWRVVVRERSSGDLLAAVSPGGRAYTTRQAVDARLGRNGEKGASLAVSAAIPKKPPGEGGSVRKPKAEVEVPFSMKVEGPPQRRSLPLADALKNAFVAIASSNGEDTNEPRQRVAMWVSGRDPNKNLAHRLMGLYVAEEAQMGGRPIYMKVDQEKPTLIFFSEDKGLWRMSHSTESKGDFAKVKEAAESPWKVTKPWKVFDGSSSYQEDSELKIQLLDPAALPSADVEVCIPKLVVTGTKRKAPAPGEAKPKKSRSEGESKGGVDDEEGMEEYLPPDAPDYSMAHDKTKTCEVQKRAHFNITLPDKTRIPFQTTWSACFGSANAALVIARACYVKFEEGQTKDEVILFRKECYDRLMEWRANKPSSGGTGGATSGSAARVSGGGDAKESPRKKKKKAETTTTKKTGGSSSSGSSSSSSSSDNEADEKKKLEGIYKQAMRRPNPPGNMVLPKMSAYTGLRCRCCYLTQCTREKKD